MARILLIDDDATALDTVGTLLRHRKYEFDGALSGEDGLRVAFENRPDVALVDLRLPDMSGIDVLAHLADSCPTTALMMFTGFATVDATVDAMRLGVCDCLVKPVFEDEIVVAVERALARGRPWTAASSQAAPLPLPDAHAALRWADPINRLLEVKQDPRTLRQFTRATGISVGAFRNWCRTAHVRARDALFFARALRAVFRFQQDASSRPENLLDIVDVRTIAKFVKRCGGTRNQLPNSVADFLERQEFITDREAVEAIRMALANRPYLHVKGHSSSNIRAEAADRGRSSNSR